MKKACATCSYIECILLQCRIENIAQALDAAPELARTKGLFTPESEEAMGKVNFFIWPTDVAHSHVFVYRHFPDFIFGMNNFSEEKACV